MPDDKLSQTPLDDLIDQINSYAKDPPFGPKEQELFDILHFKYIYHRTFGHTPSDFVISVHFDYLKQNRY